MHILYRLPILPALLWAAAAAAQISEGGIPPSRSAEFSGVFAVDPLPEPFVFSTPDVQQWFEEDAKQPDQGRFAAPLPKVDIDPLRHGRWTSLPSGDRVWRCALQAPKALGLVLQFDRFRLPPGSRFFAYTPDSRRILGAYTAQSCLPSGQFLIGIVPGEKTVLELYEPAAVAGQAQIHLHRIDYVYDPAGVAPLDSPDDFGQSYACNVNVNCALGQNWQTEKKGVARILMVFVNGTGWCTGALVANTGASGDPYFLTAHHCQLIGLQPNFSLWRFDFGYEAPTCANPAAEPAPKSVLGCERMAYRHETDFLLLKLNQIPGSYNLYFNGWNRSAATNALVQTSAFIHHPNGDIQKISKDNNPATIFAQIINWGSGFGSTPANSHWAVVPDEGIYQPGSSGSPLFDQNKRIVGQLHGGNLDTVNCTVLNSWFGRFDLSWDQGSSPQSRLKEWLDPGNLDILTQNGYVQPAPTIVSIGGTIQTHWGAPMPNVLVQVTGGATASTRTDASGKFLFGNLPAGLNYTVTPERDTNDVNGVTTFDLSLINKHVLGLDTLDSPWKILAADANASNSVSTVDVVEGRKVLLGLNTAFPANGSWRFFPAPTNFPNPGNPFTGFPGGLPGSALQYNSLQDNVTDANFQGVKVGDVNNNANSGG
ncbi:MAG: carboxypeptidase regulatory-like domain-containing protein [Saprospirales bacterium]|nr:carboxypeptidase regulatory-like domain-containing protein [Saprospirales bacterium]